MHESTQVETDVGDRRKVCQKRRLYTPRKMEPSLFNTVGCPSERVSARSMVAWAGFSGVLGHAYTPAYWPPLS